MGRPRKEELEDDEGDLQEEEEAEEDPEQVVQEKPKPSKDKFLNSLVEENKHLKDRLIKIESNIKQTKTNENTMALSSRLDSLELDLKNINERLINCESNFKILLDQVE